MFLNSIRNFIVCKWNLWILEEFWKSENVWRLCLWSSHVEIDWILNGVLLIWIRKVSCFKIMKVMWFYLRLLLSSFLLKILTILCNRALCSAVNSFSIAYLNSASSTPSMCISASGCFFGVAYSYSLTTPAARMLLMTEGSTLSKSFNFCSYLLMALMFSSESLLPGDVGWTLVVLLDLPVAPLICWFTLRPVL